MRIDVSRNDQIEQWAQRLGVTRARLIAAVAAAGPDTDRIEAWLAQRKPRERDDGRAAMRRVASHSFD